MSDAISARPVVFAGLSISAEDAALDDLALKRAAGRLSSLHWLARLGATEGPVRPAETEAALRVL